ncbi:MAG: translation initiation factor IF-2 [Myxococcota bacterium]
MAKIRAYKLAEELGIERTEFVERAGSVGVALKSAMALLEEEEAGRLRQKLGRAAVRRELVIEKRVDVGPGTTVIRRRKKVPEPTPEPVPEPVVAAPVQVPTPEPVAAPVPEPPPAPEADIPPVPGVLAPQPIRPAAERRSAEADRDKTTAPETQKVAKQRKRVREVVNLREQERLARQATGRAPMRRQLTLESRNVASPRRRRRDPLAQRAVVATGPGDAKKVVRVEGSVSVGELARLLGEKAPVVQKKLMSLGTMVSINQAVDVDTARKVASEFGYDVQDVGFREDQYFETSPLEGSEHLEWRPPVITVMGHVDHGKTSLLDAIRRTNVTAGEAGGITQHIGAYQVTEKGKKLTFIDTPGHEAFTAMRARGAQATDLVILVVAATDGVMPQTLEAIDHARAASVPIVVAINKIDLPGADPQQTRQRLLEHGLVAEEFGGDTICVNVSATQGTGLEKLLEMVSIQAEMLELKADPSLRASAVVLEASLDKGRGPSATVLVREGTLRPGAYTVAGCSWGRVRALYDENGKSVKEAGPSTPVTLIGLGSVPEAGKILHSVESERVAKEIVSHRVAEQRSQPVEEPPKISLDEFFAQAEAGGVRDLAVVIKADVHGSLEAIRDALVKLSTDAIKVQVIHTGVGAINETDVMLAKASNAIIIGFHVRPDPSGRRAAEGQGVDVRVYRIIYEVIDDVRKAMEGLLPPTITEAFLGRAEVRQTFTVPRIGTIAGSYVTEGVIRRGGRCRLMRDGVQVHEGRVGSLKRFKDDSREVATGFECGIGLEGYNDVKIGDMIEAYSLEEKPATLE